MQNAMLVIPLAADEKTQDVIKTITTSGIKDVVMVTDYDVHVDSELERYGDILRTDGFGIGKALNTGFLYAYYNGAEWIIKSDGHVVYSEPITIALDVYHDLGYKYVLLPGISPVNSNVVEWGVVLDYDTWEWKYWNYKPFRILPHATEPVLIFHRSLVEKLIKLQNYVFAIPYWGKEGFDTTLTLARLGNPVLAIDRPIVSHKYKSKFPTERINRPCIEPWCNEISNNESSWFVSIGIGDALYCLRHYSRPKYRKFYKNIERWIPIAKKYFPDRTRYLNLKYTTEQVYSMYPPLNF